LAVDFSGGEIAGFSEPIFIREETAQQSDPIRLSRFISLQKKSRKKNTERRKLICRNPGSKLNGNSVAYTNARLCVK
jgi:hypothetical protein